MLPNFITQEIEELLFMNKLGEPSLSHRILTYMEDTQLKQLNSGNMSPQTSFRELYDKFDSMIYNALKAEIDKYTKVNHQQVDKVIFGVLRMILSYLLNSLTVFNISNKLKFRSYFIEILRYNSLVRQRFTELTFVEENAPNLIQLHKGYALDRTRPIFEIEISVILNNIRCILTNTQSPYIHKLRSADLNYIKVTMDIIEQFFNDLSLFFGPNYKLSKYQFRAINSLLKSTDPLKSKDYIITSDTGTGKTEAFIFPILIYLIATRKIKGTKAIIFYPRISLTDDQFLRFCKYLYYINENLRNRDEPLITIGIEHSKAEPDKGTYKCPFCELRGEIKYLNVSYYNHEYNTWCRESRCELNPHGLDYARFSRQKDWKNFYDPKVFLPNILICTSDSLHLRMMSGYYRHIFGRIWKCQNCERLFSGEKRKCNKRGCNNLKLFPLISDINNINQTNTDDLIHLPLFLVSDEIHLYTEHTGAHIKNLFRRVSYLIENRSNLKPIKIGISATVKNPKSFGELLFNSNKIKIITPFKSEQQITGREYFLFLLAASPRLVITIDKSTGIIYMRGLSSLSAMIQTTFCTYHNLKPNTDKQRVLTFIDSISTIAKFSRYLYHAEAGTHLYLLRFPAAKYTFYYPILNPNLLPNFNCPYKNIIQGSAIYACGHMPPNQHIFPCSTYECGECWYLLSSIDPIDIQAYSSTAGISRPRASGNVRVRKLIEMQPDRTRTEEWRMRVTTNALEVGFDHPELIGVFQYLTPRSPIEFIQRKGRGGRGAEDMPITMLTFSTNPADQFFFKNSHLLIYPEENPLYIADSDFIKIQHIISSILDYIALHHNTSEVPVDIYHIKQFNEFFTILTNSRNNILKWIQSIYFDYTQPTLRAYLDLFINFIKILNSQCTIKGTNNQEYFWYFISQENWQKNASKQFKPKFKIDWNNLQTTSTNYQYLKYIWRQVENHWNNQDQNFFHIPNLLSPNFLQHGDKNLQIPFTFIPILGGGQITVYLPKENIRDSIDFILSLYTPGSIKARWNYRLYGTRLDILENRRILLSDKDYELGEDVNFNNNFIPREILNDPRLHSNNIFVKRPNTITLSMYRTMNVFYFNPQNQKVNQNITGLKLRKEPNGSPKFFRSILEIASESEIFHLDQTPFDIEFLRNIDIQKVFFGTELVLYPEDEITQIPYIFQREIPEEEAEAFLGFNHNSQGIKIDIDINLFDNVLDQIITNKPTFFWKELKLNYVFSKLIQIIINEEGNPYIIRPLCESIKAIQTYMEIINTKDLLDFFTSGKYDKFVEIFIYANKERALAPLINDIVADYIQVFFREHIDEIIDCLTEYNNDFSNDPDFIMFVRDSFYHTIKHGFIRAYQNFCYLGIRGIRGMFPSEIRYPNIQNTLLNSSIIFFDELEGGSGISETIFREITNDVFGFVDELQKLKLCDISHQEDMLISVLNLPNSTQTQIITYLKNDDLNQILVVFGNARINISMKQLEDSLQVIKKVLLVDEYTFYKEVAQLYSDLKAKLGRKPTQADILIFLDYKKPLKNPKANRFFREYLDKKYQDISAIVAKLSEIVPTCINSCPLCFDIETCEHLFPHHIISELTIFKQFFDYII